MKGPERISPGFAESPGRRRPRPAGRLGRQFQPQPGFPLAPPVPAGPATAPCPTTASHARGLAPPQPAAPEPAPRHRRQARPPRAPTSQGPLPPRPLPRPSARRTPPASLAPAPRCCRWPAAGSHPRPVQAVLSLQLIDDPTPPFLTKRVPIPVARFVVAHWLHGTPLPGYAGCFPRAAVLSPHSPRWPAATCRASPSAGGPVARPDDRRTVLLAAHDGHPTPARRRSAPPPSSPCQTNAGRRHSSRPSALALCLVRPPGRLVHHLPGPARSVAPRPGPRRPGPGAGQRRRLPDHAVRPAGVRAWPGWPSSSSAAPRRRAGPGRLPGRRDGGPAERRARRSAARLT